MYYVGDVVFILAVIRYKAMYEIEYCGIQVKFFFIIVLYRAKEEGKKFETP